MSWVGIISFYIFICFLYYPILFYHSNFIHFQYFSHLFLFDFNRYSISIVRKIYSLSSGKDPHRKIHPIAILAFYSLNYSLAARLQDNSRPKSPTKVETKRKLHQFTVSGCLIMNGGESGSEEKETLKADFLSSQKPLAASQQVLASSQNNFLSSHEYDNLMNIGLAGLSNRGSWIKLLRSLYDLLNKPIFSWTPFQ